VFHARVAGPQPRVCFDGPENDDWMMISLFMGSFLPLPIRRRTMHLGEQGVALKEMKRQASWVFGLAPPLSLFDWSDARSV